MSEPMFSGDLDFLSNFYERSFFSDTLNQRVKSAEHAFNALKTVDPEEQRIVLLAETPGEAKKIGRSVTLRPNWDTGVRVLVMMNVLSEKFKTAVLLDRLLRTQGTLLVETNHWHDQFWGSCYCDKHKDIPGQNMLGELLMVIREAGR